MYGLYDRSGNLDFDNREDIKMIHSSMSIRDRYYKDFNLTRPNVYNYEDREINVIIPQGYKYEISVDVNTPSLIYWS